MNENFQQKYVKILHFSLCHYNFVYKNGLNIDPLPFNPSGKGGGLYFCKTEDAYLFLHNGTMIADVEIPIDDRVHREGKELKADRIIISNIRIIPREIELEAINHGILIRPKNSIK